MESKYKVGDKVVIVNNPVECAFTWVKEMNEYCGREATITHVVPTDKGTRYNIDIDKGKFNWCKNCLQKKGFVNMNMFGNIEFGMNKDKNIASTLMGVAVKSEGGWMVYDKDKKSITNLGDFKPGDFPIFLIPTKSPAVGELVKYNGRYMYVTEIPEEGGVKAIAADTGRVEEIVPVKNILGMNIFTKVISIADGVLNEKGDMKKIMLLSICTGEGKPEMNQMLPLMMLADKDGEAETDDKKLMKMAMLMSACSSGDQNQMLPLFMMDML